MRSFAPNFHGAPSAVINRSLPSHRIRTCVPVSPRRICTGWRDVTFRLTGSITSIGSGLSTSGLITTERSNRRGSLMPLKRAVTFMLARTGYWSLSKCSPALNRNVSLPWSSSRSCLTFSSKTFESPSTVNWEIAAQCPDGMDLIAISRGRFGRKRMIDAAGCDVSTG